MEPSRIPGDWDDVTAAWMTAAIADAHPDAEVGEVSLLLRDDGTNRRARFGLTYAAGTGPETVFLKGEAPAHREVHARNGNLFNEADLYASKVPLPVDHPLVYQVIIDRPRARLRRGDGGPHPAGRRPPRLDPPAHARPGGQRAARPGPSAPRVLGVLGRDASRPRLGADVGADRRIPVRAAATRPDRARASRRHDPRRGSRSTTATRSSTCGCASCRRSPWAR